MIQQSFSDLMANGTNSDVTTTSVTTIPINLLIQNMIQRTPSYGSDGCWSMTGYHNTSGYPLVWDGSRVIGAHRVSWTHYFGDPGSANIRQSCGDKTCWRPEHLKRSGKSGNYVAPIKPTIIHTAKPQKLPKAAVVRKPRESYEERLYDRLNSYRICGLTPDACYQWKPFCYPDTATPYPGVEIRYGELGDVRRGPGKTTKASRLAYEFEVGPIPDGEYVLHDCDWPPCTNSRHLHTGSAIINAEEKVARGRMRVHVGDAHWANQHPEWVRSGPNHWMNNHSAEEVAKHRLGSTNGKARLAEEDVLRIRGEWDGSWKSTCWFADLFEMPKSVINGILHRKTWKHLPAQPGDVQPAAERSFARGEAVGSTILTAEIALEVWNQWQAFPNKYRARAAFCRAIAESHGVQPVAIDKILRGTTWRHVTQEAGSSATASVASSTG